MVQWESRNELAAFQHLEVDCTVQGYWEQPCKITYECYGALHNHYPDICVHYQDRREFWEIKPAAKLRDERLIARTRLLKAHLYGLGFGYRILSDELLMQQPRYANVQLLLHHRRQPASIREYEEIRLILTARHRITWTEAKAGVYGPRACAILSSLTIEGLLSVDLNSQIENEGEFQLRGERLYGRR